MAVITPLFLIRPFRFTGLALRELSVLCVGPVCHTLTGDAEVRIGVWKLPQVTSLRFSMIRLRRGDTLGENDLQPAFFTLHLA